MNRTSRDTLAAFLLALAAVALFLEIGGGSPQPALPGLPDPGLLVGWLLPFVKVLSDASAVLTIGFLLLPVGLLASRGPDIEGLAIQAARVASRWARVWVAASVALYVLTVSDTFAAPLDELTPRLLWSFFVDASQGRAIVLQALLALLVSIAIRWTASVRTLAVVLGLALATTAPITLTGHAASSGSHSLATVSLMLHVVGVTLWVGGLAALGWVAIRGSKRLDGAIERFSPLALWSLVIVGVSGAVNAAVRLGAWEQLLGSSYGRLVLLKVGALALLGVLGWWQRRRIVEQGGGFVRLATTELLLMATTMGLAVALSRTPTPVGDDVLRTPVEELLGGPLPPAPTLARILWGWSGNGVGLAVVALGLALYARGVWTLRRRGDAWPVGRTISWVLGMVVVAWATFGGLGEYAHVMFSAHMVSHMMLSMVAPIFLVLGAPVTLALRTLPGPRGTGDVSPRALLLSLLDSRLVRLLTHPLVGPVLFTGSLYGLYFSPLFQTMMTGHWGHAVMDLHFLAVGSLYYYVLIGIDPSPRNLQPLVRFGLLLVTIPFHAFFAIAVMSADTVFAGDYYAALDRSYATDLLSDQYLGGGIAWAMGEIPLLLVMGAIFVQWIRSDAREAKRRDRAAARDGDAELEAYNAHLRDLAEHGKRREP